VHDWEQAVIKDLKELTGLDRATLIDHLPELIEGLAAWLEERWSDADTAFVALADGHALQRLGVGIELPVLVVEYSWLRQVLMTRLLSVERSPEFQAQLIRLNQGLDRAIQFSIRRYTQHRDYVRDRFISILGHDLRDPLATVGAAAHLLSRSQGVGDRDKQRAMTIVNASSRMARLIGDVLDFAQGHLGGGIPIKLERCDMGATCQAAVEEVRNGHPDRLVEFSTKGDLVGLFDRDRVSQAIGNLISNAVHHGQGPIGVLVCEAGDRNAIETRVTNSGKPIPAASIARIFDPFVHLGDQAKGRLGLGLFVVAQIARAHGATCDVSSSEQETAFSIRWPRTPLKDLPDRQ